MEKTRLKTFAGMKRGDRIIILSNSNSHNYPMNVVLTLKKNGVSRTLNDAVEGVSGNNLDAGDCAKAAFTVVDLQDSIGRKEDEIARLQGEILSYREMLSICETNHITEYDPDMVKIMAILKLIEDSREELNIFQKAEIFVKAFNTYENIE